MTRSLSVHCKVSTLALAVALVVGPSPAAAQSFNGSGGFTHGSGNISTPDSVTTNITIDTPTAVIDWTPDPDNGASGQDIIFQAGGTFANFSSATDFAVLNRIDVDDMTRMIRMDGTINSKVNGVTGGSVYFYSPSGIVLGATSFIDVGSLVLTSLPVAVDGNGNFNIGGTVEFGTAADPFGNSVNPAARIETHPLSSISALAGGSYVAMVAPRVQHHGTITVDGSAALVGAEAATITFRPSGLFDIQFDVGTTDANGVAVYGDITGPAGSGSSDSHRVYLAAVPKNTAMTMLIAPGAELGFDVAQAADVVGNAVVLSAGHDVFFGSGQYNPSSASGAAANANVLNASFTSAFYGAASGNIDIAAASAGTTDFASDVSLRSSGGYVQVRSLNPNSVLNIDGDLSIDTDRIGEDNGQSVTAGAASVLAQDSGQMFIGGSVGISANGYGGGSAVAGVTAGNGTGGQVAIRADANSFLTIAGSLNANANGYGGPPNDLGVNAGNGQGGTISIGTTGNNARLEVVGTTMAHADGEGGDGDGLECFNCDGLGGNGTGGIVNLATGTGTGSTAYFGGIVELRADGLGGRTVQANTVSGSGFGGEVNVRAAGGAQVEGYGLTFASNDQLLPDLVASANGRGGASSASNTTAGLGDAGTVRIFASANSTLGILGDVEVDADGFGGYNDVGNGGDGLGGQVSFFAEGGNASVSVIGSADLEADGEGSTASSDCTECGGVGGDGIGGTVQVFNANGTDNRISFSNSLDLSAEGYGGIGVTGAAGIGDGGFANVNISNGFVLTVGAALSIEADGHGGFGINGNNGGAGIGGAAVIDGNGGSLTVTGNTLLDASGIGGNTNLGDGGNGGNGTGGNASVQPGSGTLDFHSSLFLAASGEGGDTDIGTGGNATGGRTNLIAPGSNIHVFGNLSMDGSASGGSGAVGGNATALISNVVDESDPIAAGIYAVNNGSVDIDGVAVMNGEAVGGNASNGNGGNASAGEIDVIAYFGSITIESLSVDVNAYGGNGGNGGNGGSGQAGVADITFGLGAAAVGGLIDLDSALITADGFGGAGGAGVNGAVGGSGGVGGTGIGGNVSFAGTAAGGTLDSGGAIITIRGEGGDGGAGGTGTSGAGGTGGAGGVGRGGFVQTGTLSADMAPTTGGGAAYTTLSLDAGGFGGTGGAGGTGATVNGLGGDGGNAFGGRTNFLARGVLVTADTVTMLSGATGGNGGAGSTRGNGGNATTGTIAVESKDRFNHETQRGTLQANSITGTAIAQAGIGNQNGTTAVTDGSYFRVLNGDATIGSVSITLSGAIIDPASIAPSRVSVRDGLADIDSFSFVTTGRLTLDGGRQTISSTIDGRMLSNSITLSASTFVPDTEPAPAVPGFYQAGTFDISTSGDFVTNANLISGSDLVIDAPGSIVARNINAIGPVDLFAGLNVTTANISSGDAISVIADSGAIAGGVMNAGGTILLDGATGVSTGVLGNLTAAGNIQVLSGGPIVTGMVRSNGGSVLVDGDGSVSVESVNAAGSATLLAGTSFGTGDINAGGPVTITAAAGSMDIGNMTAGGAVNLVAGDTILGEDIITPGPITASAGTGLLRLETLQSGGAVDLFAGGNVSTLDITAAGLIRIISSGGSILTGNLNGTNVTLDAESGDIEFGDVAAALFDFDAGGTATGGNIVATSASIGSAGGAVVLGNITVTGAPPVDEFSVGVSSGTSIVVGNVIGTDKVGFATFGNLTAGDLQAGNLIMALVGGNMTTGSMTTTQQFGRIYMADSQMYVDAGGLDDNFQLDLVLNADIIPSGGSVTVNGPVSTDLLEIAAGGLISFNGDVTASGSTLMSGDLALANGVTVSGFTSLYSISGQGTFIGDGLSGPGYMLSNAEYNAFQDVGMEVRPDLGAAALLTIGDLNIGSGIAEAAFAIEDADDNDLGTIRVVGDVRMNNADGLLFLESETFQLDASTGSIVISADGTTPGGELVIAANNIHVAEGSILDQLSNDPQYAGYQDDLNDPASTPRPNGVIRAGTVSIEFGDTPADLYTLYVQNMGTAETPAGFVITDMNLGDDGDTTLPAGSVDLIINGQVITQDGTLTGVDVRDLLVQGRDLTPFTENSTVNGCVLVGECGEVVEPPPPETPLDRPDFQPSPGIQQEIVLAKDNILPPPEFGNEDLIDDNDEETEEGATSPIVPPDPLFDTSAMGEESEAAAPEVGSSMRSSPGLTQPGDVDDPVSGSGNPALMETQTPPSNQEKQQ